jgi:RNA polymerase sigma-70 factor (ECF subfamily)
MTFPLLRFWFAPESDDGADSRADLALSGTRQGVAAAGGDLVTRIRSGDERAFAELYHEHFDALWTFARTFVFTSDAAKDAVQDVFLALWLQRRRWTVVTTVQAYLFGAVRNRALKTLRRDRSDARAVQHVVHDVEANDHPAETVQAPDQLAAANELERAVAHIIETLPERQRTAVELKWRYDLSWAEVGEAMSISKVAAWKLGAAAQRRLAPLRERFGGG